MTLYKRGDAKSASWYVDFVDTNGKRQRVSLNFNGGKRQAAAKARALVGDRERIEPTPSKPVAAAPAKPEPSKPIQPYKPEKPTITLRAALTAYTMHLAALGKASAHHTAGYTKKTMGGYPGRYSMDPEMLLHDLQPSDIAKLAEARRKEGAANQTIAHEIKSIRAAAHLAAGNGFQVPTDMLSGVIRHAWKMPPLPKKTRYLTPSEFTAVYEYLDPDREITVKRGGQTMSYPLIGYARDAREDCRDLLVMLALSGGRWSEVTTLRWDQIDTLQLLAWSHWWQSDRTGPRPPVNVKIWGNKTQSERLVGMPDMACEMLLRRFLNNAAQKPLVFPSQKTGELRVHGSHAIRKAMDEAGVNTPDKVKTAGRATVHSLRHTFASLLLQNGAGLPDIQAVLGHTTMAMTLRYAALERGATATKLANILSSVIAPTPRLPAPHLSNVIGNPEEQLR